MSTNSRTTGADLIWSVLSQLGLQTVFGLPGTQTVPLYDALRGTRSRTVLSSSETAAAFAANGYYRATGRPAALVTIPGPGVTMAATGLTEALHDSAALLHLTVSKPGKRPPFDLQRIDMPSFAATCAKKLITISTTDEIVSSLCAAWQAATQGEPGPVIVECSQAVITAPAESSRPREIESPKVDSSQITTIAERLIAARHPVILCGQGCFGQSEYLSRLVQNCSIAVVPTCSGRGVLPDDHPMVLPVDFANSSWTVVNRLFDDADLILALGCKLSHNGTAGFRLPQDRDKLVHVDLSADVLNANYEASLAVQADLATLLPVLVEKVDGRRRGNSQWTSDQIDRLKVELAEGRRDSLSHLPLLAGVRPDTVESFFDALGEIAADDSIVVTDSGLHQIATRAFWTVRSERGLIVPSDFQSMGYGIPAAIGAAIGSPDRPVIAVVGDGGLAMTGMELGVAVRENLDLTVIVFSDGYLGQIRVQQLSDSGSDHAVELPPLDIESWARSQQLAYHRAEGDIVSSLKTALALPGPRLVELPLVDSPRLKQIRKIQTAKNQARKLLGSEASGWLKRFLGGQ